MKLMERVFIKKENIKSSLINTKNKIVGFFDDLFGREKKNVKGKAKQTDKQLEQGKKSYKKSGCF